MQIHTTLWTNNVNFTDAVNREIDIRKIRDLQDSGDLPADISAMPILEVMPSCKCDAGLEPHQDDVLACPACHKPGIAREVF